RSAAVVVEPELEEWLWRCPRSIAQYLGSNAGDFDSLINRIATKLNLPRERCCAEKPKELFDSVLYQKRRRKPLPEDFETLGSSANLANWHTSQTFDRLVKTLMRWFPLS